MVSGTIAKKSEARCEGLPIRLFASVPHAYRFAERGNCIPGRPGAQDSLAGSWRRNHGKACAAPKCHHLSAELDPSHFGSRENLAGELERGEPSPRLEPAVRRHAHCDEHPELVEPAPWRD